MGHGCTVKSLHRYGGGTTGAVDCLPLVRRRSARSARTGQVLGHDGKSVGPAAVTSIASVSATAA